MSSIVVCIRALVMLGCLVAVPVLAVTQPVAVARVRQAGATLLDRIWAEPAEMARSASPPTRSRPSDGSSHRTTVEPTQVHRSLQLMPGPVADEPPLPPVTPAAAVQHVPMAERPASAADASAGRATGSSEVHQWRQQATTLQELGAVEYALEKWGTSEKLYRFRCRVALEDAPTYHRHFEAVDENGGRAVDQVLRQVREWRNDNASVN